MFSDRSRFTDDTVLTVAVADVILHGKDYAETLVEYFSDYPNAGYGGTFIEQAMTGKLFPYNSWENGSAMRVGPVGFAFDTALPPSGLISYGFFFGWAPVCFGCGGGCFGWSGGCFGSSGGCVGLCSRTIFPSQEMYALVISSRSFFKLSSISATLCSRVLCSSGICSFLSGLAYYREVDSLLRAECPVDLPAATAS
jgi:hypothetical protein